MRIRVILLGPGDMTDIDEKSTGEDASKIAWLSIEPLRFLQASALFNGIHMDLVYLRTTFAKAACLKIVSLRRTLFFKKGPTRNLS